MAEPKKDDDDKDSPRKRAAGGGQMKLVIGGALALFVALVGAQVAAPLINKALEGGSHAVETEEGLEGDEVLVEEDVQAPEPEHLDPAIYVSLDPPFVVSFQAPDGQHYLQLTLQAMTRTKKTVEAVQTHSPAIRNSFLLLLSSFDINTLDTVDGKQKLRAEMLNAANEILAQNRAPGSIEELYFTSLVTQ